MAMPLASLLECPLESGTSVDRPGDAVAFETEANHG
jgi:hypothetical protein